MRLLCSVAAGGRKCKMHLAFNILLALVPKDKVLYLFLACLFLPVLLICILFSGPAVIHERVPMVTPEQAMLYFNAAKTVSDSTKSLCDDGVVVNWQEVLAVDAIRLKQNFREANQERANELAQLFVKKSGQCSQCRGSGEDRT